MVSIKGQRTRYGRIVTAYKWYDAKNKLKLYQKQKKNKRIGIKKMNESKTKREKRERQLYAR